MSLARGHFGPRGIILTNLVEVHYVILHTKCQGSKPYGLRQEDFFMFFAIKAYQNVNPRGGSFLAPGI